MRALSASNLLVIWERGAGKTSIERALTILSVAFPQIPDDTLPSLDIVQRDICLLQLRGLTFGSEIKGLADCPACSQHLELDFDTRDLPASSSPLPDPETIKPLNSETFFGPGNYEVTFRLPNSMDLSLVSKMMDPTARRQQLLEACVISVRRDGKTLSGSDLPTEVVDALIERMSQDNPITNLTLPVTCPDCGAAWEILFDIVSYFWGEINAWSIRLMREVHILAMAYGWRETDILAMSAWRRQQYIELIGA